MAIYFSIIIPHKNIPNLLQRCIDAIPQRDDLEIIIIDDNSNPLIVDFEQFPGHKRTNIHLIFTKEGKGAGYARNIGLKHAKGKWIIFADADDYFTEDFEQLLNKYVNEETDLIYFKPRSTSYYSTKKESERVKTYQQLFDGEEKFLRYAYVTPWGKFIKRSIIEKNHFKFDETRWGNDAYFMTQVATTAKDILITHDYLYIVEEREGSLTNEKMQTKDEIICRLSIDIRAYQYAETIGFTPFIDILLVKCIKLLSQKQYHLLMRTIHTLPNTALHKIKERMIHQLNLKGQILIRSLFFFAPLTSKLS